LCKRGCGKTQGSVLTQKKREWASFEGQKKNFDGAPARNVQRRHETSRAGGSRILILPGLFQSDLLNLGVVLKQRAGDRRSGGGVFKKLRRNPGPE